MRSDFSFYDWWKYGPAQLRSQGVLNPSFDPKAAGRSNKVTESMEADGFYSNHTREECKAEWGRRYDALKAKGE